MKMNDTVARIVEIMFQDVEMNEETSAIRDEVMNNCQERFNDLTNAGVAEDDAIAAVVESLKGMEDVLAPYKKSAHSHAEADELEDMEDFDDEESGERNMTFHAEAIHQISVCLISEDIALEASDDGDYHVIWDAKEAPQVEVSDVNGVLKVERRPGESDKAKKVEKVEFDNENDMSEFLKTEEGKIESNMDSISRALKSLGEKIKLMFADSRINIRSIEGKVTIQVPENAMPRVKVLTTSGNIDVQEVTLTDLHLTSTSGDINVDLEEAQRLEHLEMRTTSGDMEVTAHTDLASIASTSGDVEVEGRHNKLCIATISGDVDVRADVVNMNFSAVSGDVDLRFDSEEIRKVCGSTVSGDIEIELPEGVGTIAIQTQTRTGDVTTRHHTTGVGTTVNGSVSSMSGDITIR